LVEWAATIRILNGRNHLMRSTFAALVLASVAMGVAAPQAGAADRLKIGFIATLSGPASSLGQSLFEGFTLAVEELDGKVGGLPTEVSRNDAQFKPDVARQLADRLVKRDHVDIVTGIVFSNVMMAIYNTVVDSKTILVGSNAGPSQIAGKDCSPYFFSASWQNDQPHAAVGKLVQDQGVKRIFLVATNYRAGQDALAGFKSMYKGAVVGEVYPALQQPDYAAEIAQIADSDADATYAFIAGAQAVNFARQYAEAGLMATKPLYSGFMINALTLPELGDIALGARSAAFWTPDLDNPESRHFVEAYRKKYHAMPAVYAAQAYDSVKLIDAAVRQIGGRVEDKEAFIAALAKADFKSIRGPFRYNHNHFPIENFYATEIAKAADGTLYEKNMGLILKDAEDAYAHECPMK
jgi:branched-chain amino acid transport system substrate-binding protein